MNSDASEVPLLVGASLLGGLPDWRLSATLDEVRMWDYARTRDEIVATQDKKLTGKEKGLVSQITVYSSLTVCRF
jgi:hypothetical protein